MGVVAQPVAEQEADAGGVAALGEDVDVDVLGRRPEHPVAGLAEAGGGAGPRISCNV